jgi:hypothetical protein
MKIVVLTWKYVLQAPLLFGRMNSRSRLKNHRPHALFGVCAKEENSLPFFFYCPSYNTAQPEHKEKNARFQTLSSTAPNSIVLVTYLPPAPSAARA